MEEKTTTESPAVESTGEQTIQGVPVDSQGVALSGDSQPAQAEEEAVSQAEGTESTQTDSGEIDNQSKAGEDDLAKWAANKGIAVTTESERRLAEMARESEKAFHQKAQEASAASKMQDTVSNPDLINESDPIASELATIRSQLAITNFYAANPDARSYDEKMGEVLAEDPALLEYVRQTGNIDAVYKIAKASDIESRVDTLKNDGGREALTNLAAKQSAAAIKGSATNTAPVSSNVDLDNLSREEYIRLRDSGELNRLLAQ